MVIDNEKIEANNDLASNEDNNHSGDVSGLSPSSNNSCDEKESDHDIKKDKERDSYQETPYSIRDQDFIDKIDFQDRGHNNSRRDSYSTKSKRQFIDVLEDSFSFNIS